MIRPGEINAIAGKAGVRGTKLKRLPFGSLFQFGIYDDFLFENDHPIAQSPIYHAESRVRFLQLLRNINHCSNPKGQAQYGFR